MDKKKYRFSITISSEDDNALVTKSSFMIVSNISKDKIRLGYKKSVFKTGLDFENCLVLEDKKIFIPGEYRMTGISQYSFDAFKKIGLDLNDYAIKKEPPEAIGHEIYDNAMLEIYKNLLNENGGAIYYCSKHEDFARLILDFIKSSSNLEYSLIEYEIEDESIPHIGGEVNSWVLFN